MSLGDVYRIPHSLLFSHTVYENNNTGRSCCYFSGFTSDLLPGLYSYRSITQLLSNSGFFCHIVTVFVHVSMYVNLCDIYF